MKNLTALFVVLFLFIQCTDKKTNSSNVVSEKVVDNELVDKLIRELVDVHGKEYKDRIGRGVNQIAELWRNTDGSKADFESFCKDNFISDEGELKLFFEKVSRDLEILWGNFNQISIGLKEPLDLDGAEITEVDRKFGGYDPSVHLEDDLYSNKIAFLIALNFPFYTLEEKKELGTEWSDLDWAYARLGDIYTARVPADLIQEVSEVTTLSGTYISEYNIYMGKLLDNEGKSLFKEDKKLITHWGLRDELKSQYADQDGMPKQEMIYQVMLHIIDQSIPEEVINSDKYNWNPIENKLMTDGNEIAFEREPDTRYQHLLDNFKVVKKIDKYNKQYPSYIKRKFDGDMELSQEEVEALFVEFVSSPVIKEIGALISRKLDRPLRPYDIWYDGFKARSAIDETELDEMVSSKYPSKEAFQKDLPNMLHKLGFSGDLSYFIASKISVDPSRGAGHAWGAEMRSGKSHLRTRVEKSGMNYKGYNIAVHEFGHNVEQTISLQDVNHYLLHGVPNNAFTEALAFIFQKRDLMLLGIDEKNEDKEYLDALDITWSTYEIMGVSLVDMNVWKWLYDNPDATAVELKAAVISIAKDVWNKYYAPVFGIQDSPILAVYSHMISYPLYLSAYPLGHLIDFQIEKQLAGNNFADEVYRMYTQGRIIPQLWMQGAIDSEISGQPMLEAAKAALAHFDQ